MAGPRPAALIAAAQSLPASPARAVAECRLLVYLGALGRAWSVCGVGIERWPTNQDLRWLQIDLAARLSEPQLLEEVLESLHSQATSLQTQVASQLTGLQNQITELVGGLQDEGQNRQQQVDKLKLQLQLLHSEKLVQLGEYQGSVSAELAEEVRRQLRDLEERIGSIPL